MDSVALTFYAVVCGLLGAFLPQTVARWGRFAIGAVIGIVAASLLPLLRGFM